MTNLSGHQPRSRSARHVAAKLHSRTAKTALNTIPLVLVGSMAMSLGLSGPVEAAGAKRVDKPRVSPSELGKVLHDALAAASSRVAPKATAPGTVSTAGSAPSTYRVAAGDTVSSIAIRYGLPTASVLALNGLGWKSVIFPGQILKLTRAGSAAPVPKKSQAAPAGRYTIVSGDTISAIAARFHLPTSTVLSANGLSASSIIYPGETLAIPGQGAAGTPAGRPAKAASSVTFVRQSSVRSTAAQVPDRYVIAAGDTISSIATRFGLSIQDILNANGLNWSSIIYTGRTLVIPDVTIAPASTTSNGAQPTRLTAEMSRNAKTIIKVGKSLGVSDYGLVIALSAAMQESGLRNLHYGDLDSLGLFQQRPSTGWGTPDQVTDPAYAARLFFGGPDNPNHGTTRGLLEIPGWQAMTVTQAAQAVQQSAYPDAYAQWEASAWIWLDQLS